MKPRIGRHKVDRIEALPKIVRDIGWKAQVRLCARYRRLSARGKNANVVNIAIAREMVGFIWSIACTIQSAPRGRDHDLTNSQERRSQTPLQPRRVMRRWGQDNAGEPSRPL
jgi:transposase